MTDIRAALEELLNQWDAEVGAMPDSRVRTVLESCAMEVRAILLDPVIAHGMYEIARADLLSDIDALVAAVRVDERTRLSGETPSRIHLLGMLASMEWVQPTSNSSPSCPWCGSQKHFGHNSGCSLATAIAGQEP